MRNHPTTVREQLLSIPNKESSPAAGFPLAKLERKVEEAAMDTVEDASEQDHPVS
jgi:hypothetical protein